MSVLQSESGVVKFDIARSKDLIAYYESQKMYYEKLIVIQKEILSGLNNRLQELQDGGE